MITLTKSKAHAVHPKIKMLITEVNVNIKNMGAGSNFMNFAFGKWMVLRMILLHQQVR